MYRKQSRNLPCITLHIHAFTMNVFVREKAQPVHNIHHNHDLYVLYQTTFASYLVISYINQIWKLFSKYRYTAIMNPSRVSYTLLTPNISRTLCRSAASQTSKSSIRVISAIGLQSHRQFSTSRKAQIEFFPPLKETENIKKTYDDHHSLTYKRLTID